MPGAPASMMIPKLCTCVLLAWSFLLLPSSATCVEDRSELTNINKKLIIGTKETPPFAMKDSNGHWTGISINLWRQIAEELNLTYEWRELDQSGLLAGVTDGSLDAVVANLTITPGRLDNFDFTYPFFTTGLGIAVKINDENVGWTLIYQIFNWTVLKIILAVMSLLFLVGLLIWLLERKKNKEHFGGSSVQGIASGVWFSAVTMTTVGYGDKHPKTSGGRLVALFWMFLSIILVSLFTATITSLLTVKQLMPSVRGLEDIKKVAVGTLPYTTSESFLQANRVSFTTYPSVAEGLEALNRGEIKAFVYDIPAQRYWIKQKFSGKLELLPHSYSQENYGIALKENCPLRKPINRLLLEKIRDQEWQGILYHYLGN
jgi:polar amino acid transport system substrate-binding protein